MALVFFRVVIFPIEFGLIPIKEFQPGTILLRSERLSLVVNELEDAIRHQKNFNCPTHDHFTSEEIKTLNGTL